MLKFSIRVSIYACVIWMLNAANAETLTSVSYKAWLGDVNGDGINDIYLEPQPKFVLLHGEIAIPVAGPKFGNYLFSYLGEEFVIENHYVMYGTASGGMGEPEFYGQYNNLDLESSGFVAMSIFVGDFSGGDENEMLVRSPYESQNSYLMSWSSTLSRPNISLSQVQALGVFNGALVSNNVGVLSVVDINTDGKDDVAIYNNGNLVKVLLGGENGFALTGAQEEDPTPELILKDFIKSLSEGNNEKALRYIEPSSRIKYSRVFGDLAAELPAIAQGFSPPLKINTKRNYAEFAVSQVINGKNSIHICSFIKNYSGVWLITGF